MKIAINALSAKSQHHGVGVYITNILKHLIPLTGQHDFLLYKRNSLNLDNNLQSIKNIKYRNIDKSRYLRIVWEQTFLPIALKKERFDLLWGPCNFLPLIKPCRFVVTIHDLAPFLLPRSLPFIRRTYYQRAFLNSIYRADQIVVVSESLKTDLMRLFSLPEKKIYAIHNGIDESFHPVTDKILLSQIQNKYQLPTDFILTLGVLEPKKNTIGLIQAYADLRKSYAELPKLVIGGSKQYGWKNNQVFEMVKNLGVEKDIIFTGTIAHEDLPAVYTLTTLFVLPSIYEGFGLPVAEAMACGTPVITSNTSSLPEVASDAAILVNPLNVQEISKAISQVLANKGMQKEMTEKGIKNSKRFSWNKAASSLLEVFNIIDKG